MKKVVIVITLNLFSLVLFAGPFGLEMGMNLSKVTELCNGREPVHISDDRYYIIPQNTHPDFSRYVAWISETEGLYYLKAIGSNISTSVYGTSLIAKFNEIYNSLTKKYGDSEKYDFLLPSSIWNEPNDWMIALEKEERVLAASWSKENKSTLPESIISITLVANANSDENGFLTIEYEFANHSKAEEDLKDKEGEVF